MTQKKQIYKCSICGNITEVIHEGAGELVCCGKPMDLMEGKTKEEGTEKHMPIIDIISENEISVKVGEVDHPMENIHYIEWIEAIMIDGSSIRKFLKPEEKPEAIFNINNKIESIRAYCNIHGLWLSEIK